MNYTEQLTTLVEKLPVDVKTFYDFLSFIEEIADKQSFFVDDFVFSEGVQLTKPEIKKLITKLTVKVNSFVKNSGESLEKIERILQRYDNVLSAETKLDAWKMVQLTAKQSHCTAKVLYEVRSLLREMLEKGDNE